MRNFTAIFCECSLAFPRIFLSGHQSQSVLTQIAGTGLPFLAHPEQRSQVQLVFQRVVVRLCVGIGEDRKCGQ